MHDTFTFYFCISCFSLKFLAIESALCTEVFPHEYKKKKKIWKEIMCTNDGNIRSHIVIHVPFMNSKPYGLKRVTVTN